MPHSAVPEPTILIIDDDEAALGTYSRFLRLEHYHAVTAATAEAGIAAFDARRPDAILVDLKLPEIDDGLRVLRELRNRDQGVPIAVITGHYDVDDGTEMAIGCFHASLVYKPLWIDSLLDVVRELLHGA
jgi:two-component system, repressor protein LuxO